MSARDADGAEGGWVRSLARRASSEAREESKRAAASSSGYRARATPRRRPRGCGWGAEGVRKVMKGGERGPGGSQRPEGGGKDGGPGEVGKSPSDRPLGCGCSHTLGFCTSASARRRLTF